MEACAWLLERNGRLPERDAWAAVGVETPVGRGVGDAAGYRAGQKSLGRQACAGKSLQINYPRPWAPAGARGLDQHVAI